MGPMLKDTPYVLYPDACPGCDEDFDPRQHTETWCQDCRPANGTTDRPARGDDDGLVRASFVSGAGDSETDPANQRAAGALWGRTAGGQ